jgi:hypothetical protein
VLSPLELLTASWRNKELRRAAAADDTERDMSQAGCGELGVRGSGDTDERSKNELGAHDEVVDSVESRRSGKRRDDTGKYSMSP